MHGCGLGPVQQVFRISVFRHRIATAHRKPGELPCLRISEFQFSTSYSPWSGENLKSLKPGCPLPPPGTRPTLQQQRPRLAPRLGHRAVFPLPP